MKKIMLVIMTATFFAVSVCAQTADEADRMEARAAPMEALGREMEAAGRPMEQIGKEMEAVGKRLERETNATDAEIRRIIDDAYARGLATPAPSTH